jgi:hypothetical protein
VSAGIATTPLRRRSAAGVWLAFLQKHIEPSWRRHEWDPTTMVFTGDLENPATIAYACQTPGCTARSIVKQGQCVRCRTEKARGKEPGPTEPFPEVLCGASGVPGCAIPFVSNGLCHHHQKPFRSALHRNPRLSVAAWAKGQTAYAALGPCAIGWCDRQRRANVTGFCKGHYRLYNKSRFTDESAYAATVLPPIASSDFRLADCSPTLAAEVIYGLQCRDHLGLAVNPFYVRDLITLIQGAPALASVERESLHPKAIQMLDNLKPSSTNCTTGSQAATCSVPISGARMS